MKVEELFLNLIEELKEIDNIYNPFNWIHNLIEEYEKKYKEV